jgi:hypothetical protein
MSSESSFDMMSSDGESAAPVRTPSKPTTQTLGDSSAHLKGFASAFQTIMARPEEQATGLIEFEEQRRAEEKPDKKIHLPLPAHNPTPSLEEERELALSSTAKRGVMKLFKAVAMHRKQNVNKTTKLAIGYGKNGQRRRVQQCATTEPSKQSVGTMSGFLDMLKQQKPIENK